MNKKDDEIKDLFDEIDDDEEEIKEDIVIENDEIKDNNDKQINNQYTTTYDKFLIDSVAIDGIQNRNEYHYILKNQMVNIIDDIKKKQDEEQKNKNNIKKMIYQNMENIFFNKNMDEKKNKKKIMPLIKKNILMEVIIIQKILEIQMKVMIRQKK